MQDTNEFHTMCRDRPPNLPKDALSSLEKVVHSFTPNITSTVSSQPSASYFFVLTAHERNQTLLSMDTPTSRCDGARWALIFVEKSSFIALCTVRKLLKSKRPKYGLN